MSAKNKLWILVDEKGDVPYSGKRGAMFVYFNRTLAESDRKYLKEMGEKNDYRIKECFVKYK